MAKKKTSTKKKAPSKKAPTRKPVPKFKASSRKVYSVPLAMIVNNPGNPGDIRDSEVISALYEQGYRIFPQKDFDADHTLWTMLNGQDGKVDDDLRQQAVQLIAEFEPSVVEFARSIEGADLVNVIQIVVVNGVVGIESGLLRAFSRSFSDAQAGKPPGIVDAEVSSDRSMAKILARAAVENLNVITSSPIGIAQRLKFARDNKMSLEDVAKMIGRTEQTVRNYLNLLKTPEDVQQAVAGGSMTMQKALAMEQESRSTGRDIEEVADEQSPTRGGGGKGKKKKPKALPFDKVWLIYVAELQPPNEGELTGMKKEELVAYIQSMHDHKVTILQQIMQVSEAEAEKLLKEEVARQTGDILGEMLAAGGGLNLDDLDD